MLVPELAEVRGLSPTTGLEDRAWEITFEGVLCGSFADFGCPSLVPESPSLLIAVAALLVGISTLNTGLFCCEYC